MTLWGSILPSLGERDCSLFMNIEILSKTLPCVPRPPLDLPSGGGTGLCLISSGVSHYERCVVSAFNPNDSLGFLVLRPIFPEMWTLVTIGTIWQQEKFHLITNLSLVLLEYRWVRLSPWRLRKTSQKRWYFCSACSKPEDSLFMYRLYLGNSKSILWRE